MRKNSTNNIRQLCSCVIMALALAWLTVSIPFVYDCQQRLTDKEVVANLTTPMEEECNSFANTTEEKHEGGSNSLSEYIHDMHLQMHYIGVVAKYRKCHPSDLYYAYHPELISPPPESALS
ncbi:MAG TPA: hypothetical protein VD996_15930 [Chitinophagaceae bacterium]|nr:hypothetical protein [Chitinophagaceae bacterium]